MYRLVEDIGSEVRENVGILRTFCSILCESKVTIFFKAFLKNKSNCTAFDQAQPELVSGAIVPD